MSLSTFWLNQDGVTMKSVTFVSRKRNNDPRCIYSADVKQLRCLYTLLDFEWLTGTTWMQRINEPTLRLLYLDVGRIVCKLLSCVRLPNLLTQLVVEDRYATVTSIPINQDKSKGNGHEL